MHEIFFVTGNPNKAKNMSRLLGTDISSYMLNLEEIQSRSPEVIIEHKVRQDAR